MKHIIINIEYAKYLFIIYFQRPAWQMESKGKKLDKSTWIEVS
tara:strand:- start:222 stop:350 length:129 start_codon:yes stop_codon:yes gene_type:complete